MTAPSVTTEPVIAARGLSKRFGSKLALDGVDIEVGGGITGLVGANGAGKSTFLKLVLGLIEPSEGEITTLSHNPTQRGDAVRSRVGYFPERNVLPDTMPAHEFVRHMTQLRGVPRAQARGRASDALWSVGLGEERFRVLGTMSTGQRQRVKLAQALAADPVLVLLDEPTEGMDPVQRSSMLQLIADVRDTHGVDIVMCSHVLGEVEQVCTSIIALDAGKLVLSGTTQNLLESRQSAMTGGEVDTALAQVSLELVEPAAGAGSDTPAADAVTTALNTAGCTVSISGSRLMVIAPMSLAADQDEQTRYDALCDLCRDCVADAGVRLRQMGARSQSLEEVLLATADHGAYTNSDVSPVDSPVDSQ